MWVELVDHVPIDLIAPPRQQSLCSTNYLVAPLDIHLIRPPDITASQPTLSARLLVCLSTPMRTHSSAPLSTTTHQFALTFTSDGGVTGAHIVSIVHTYMVHT